MWFNKSLSEEQLKAIEKELQEIRKIRLPHVKKYGRDTLDINALIYWCDKCKKTTSQIAVFHDWVGKDKSGHNVRMIALDEAINAAISRSIKNRKPECQYCKENSKLISIIFFGFDDDTKKDRQVLYDALKMKVLKRYDMDKMGTIKEFAM